MGGAASIRAGARGADEEVRIAVAVDIPRARNRIAKLRVAPVGVGEVDSLGGCCAVLSGILRRGSIDEDVGRAAPGAGAIRAHPEAGVAVAADVRRAHPLLAAG